MDVHGSGVLRYHASMLADALRTESYRRAIERVVRSGDVVAEIGTGTGVLAHFAARAGARRVYAIERGPAVELARLVRDGNPTGERISVIHGASQGVDLPERADVLVTETLWNFGLGEGMVDAVIDARRRLLKVGARIIPSELEMIIAPVEYPRGHRIVDLWGRDLYGLDFSSLRSFAANNHQHAVLTPAAFLSVPTSLARIALTSVSTPEVAASARIRVARSGTMHGIAGWFRARLAPGVELTNAPPLRTPNWSHVFFPLEEPRPVDPGAHLVISVRSTGNGGVWSWDVHADAASAPRRRPRQSTMWGFPPATGRARRPVGSDHPVASPRGRAVARVLALADGRMTLDAIAERVRQEHGDAFEGERSAAELTRTIVGRFC